MVSTGVKPEVTRALLQGLHAKLAVAVMHEHGETTHTLVEVEGSVVINYDFGTVMIVVTDEQARQLGSLDNIPETEGK